MKKIALESGASFCGIAEAADLGVAFNRFVDILPANPPGLSYLSTESRKRRNIKNWFSQAKSVLICGFQYWNSGFDLQPRRPLLFPLPLKGEDEGEGIKLTVFSDYEGFFKKTGRKLLHPELLEYFGKTPEISRYALSFDYHKTIRKILKTILCRIKEILPGVEGKIFVDTSLVMEKEFARLSGLGWQGKNTLILSKGRGSWFFTGGIALSAELEPDSTVENLCGGCDACIRACPVKALKNPGVLDAGLCISYWNTQHKEKLDRKIAGDLDCWLYGCDVCQQACPYNQNVIEPVINELRKIG